MKRDGFTRNTVSCLQKSYCIPQLYYYCCLSNIFIIFVHILIIFDTTLSPLRNFLLVLLLYSNTSSKCLCGDRVVRMQLNIWEIWVTRSTILTYSFYTLIILDLKNSLLIIIVMYYCYFKVHENNVCRFCSTYLGIGALKLLTFDMI